MITLLRQAFSMMRPALRWRWGMIVASALVGAALETVGTGAVFGVITVIADPSQIHRIPMIGDTLSALAARNPAQAPLIIGIGVIIFFIAKNLFMFTHSYWAERTCMDSVVAGAGQLLKGYLRAPFQLYFQRNPAELTRNLSRTIDDVFGGVVRSTVGLVAEGFVLLALLAVLLVAQPAATAIAALTIGTSMILVSAISKRVLITRGRRVQALATQILQGAQEAIGAAKDIRILGREDFFWSRFIGRRRESADLQRLTLALLEMPRLALETAMVIGLVNVALVLAMQGESASVVPTLGLFGYVGFRILPSVTRLLSHVGHIRQFSGAVEVIWADYSALCAPDLHAQPDEPPMPFERELRLSGISYAYPGGRGTVLDAIDLVVPVHASIGIVGSSGAGKSTLVDIILGLLAPSSGQVLVDEKDIAGHMRSWQRRIGYVPQSIYLTDDSLRNNIAFGIPIESINEERLREAAAMASVLEFIESLPEGFDTMVGDRGLLLSGGQRQRIGIARALYHQPELLIFDEATSALDSETEREVATAIDSLAGCKTVIMVAHRLTTLTRCDSLVFLKQGRLAATGTMAELIERDEDFRRLAASSGVLHSHTGA
ncbi:ABC transporter ATP-binding protein [Magnetospirillum sp. SS-4]|uniref:ABC transporter ATP-binding protein n=1 Tax=Magnetospirillum sp. SS-4 TaxID=2681465 RepID=UPI0013835A65|nr:ABC transporter ATP-binding protein [Magnetospirillum sp. SS-4]CAA7614467.1 putative ABC-type multidrug transport system, ATPase and permease component [Magnetospirillum sp. SS-4]